MALNKPLVANYILVCVFTVISMKVGNIQYTSKILGECFVITLHNIRAWQFMEMCDRLHIVCTTLYMSHFSVYKPPCNFIHIAMMDFLPVTRTLTFGPGVDTMVETIDILSDDTNEGTGEFFLLKLTPLTNVVEVLSNQSLATVTIEESAG